MDTENGRMADKGEGLGYTKWANIIKNNKLQDIKYK